MVRENVTVRYMNQTISTMDGGVHAPAKCLFWMMTMMMTMMTILKHHLHRNWKSCIKGELMALRQLDLNDSTNVNAAWWDDEKQELIVQFVSRSSGAYLGVSEEEAQAFEQAASPGKYVHDFLKTRFPWVRR
jgi:KTSC domain